jgi:hypothetical protein
MHIINNRYRYGEMEDIMDIMDPANEGKIMNKKKFYKYLYKSLNLLIKGKRIQEPNNLFNIAM